MPVAFGFSVGDFINGLNLLQKSIAALNSADGAYSTLKQLEAELANLHLAVQTVFELVDDGIIPVERVKRINSALRACQKCIDDFCQQISQYQKHMKRDNNSWKSCYTKIKWALCKQDDVARLRSMLSVSAHPITIILSAQQSRAIHTLTETIEEHNELIAPGIEYEDKVQEMTYILKDLSMQQARSLEAAEQHHRVSLSKFEALQTLSQYQGESLPGQIMLEQPVILLDALGRIAPFHLEFVDTLEAFVAVMMVRFRQAEISEVGIRRLVNLEFTLRDTKKKCPIDLTKRWRSALRPGQVIDMNMLCPAITYQLARLNAKKPRLVCYNFWFPCLMNTPSQQQTSLLPLIGPASIATIQTTQQYDRLEEFARVHLILEHNKQQNGNLSVSMEAHALSTFMECVGNAFSIDQQHLIVTIDSAITIEPGFSDSDSSSAICSMRRSSLRDFARQRQKLRPSLPEGWDCEDSYQF